MSLKPTVNPLRLLLAVCSIFLINICLSAAPCGCKDLPQLRERAQRANKAEEAWKEIFAWARGLHIDISPPDSNEALNARFGQLMSALPSKWDGIMHQPIDLSVVPKKIGGLTNNGEPIFDPEFEARNCDEIVQGVREHEETHKRFFFSHPGQVLTGDLLRVRAESEVESYRAEKEYLNRKVKDMADCDSCDGQWHGTITYTNIDNFTSKTTVSRPVASGNSSSSTLESTNTLNGIITKSTSNEWQANSSAVVTFVNNRSTSGQGYCHGGPGGPIGPLVPWTRNEVDITQGSGNSEGKVEAYIFLYKNNYQISVRPLTIRGGTLQYTTRYSLSGGCSPNKPPTSMSSSSNKGEWGTDKIVGKANYGADRDILSGSDTKVTSTPSGSTQLAPGETTTITNTRTITKTITWNLRRCH